MWQYNYTEDLCHGGPGSGRYPAGSTGNTPGTRKKVRVQEGRNVKANLKTPKGLALAGNMAKGAKTGVEGSSKIVDAASNIRKTKIASKVDPTKMSDQELRQKINRMDMEARYSDMIASKSTSRGATYAKNALAIAGGIADIAISALTIAGGIMLLKKK